MATSAQTGSSTAVGGARQRGVRIHSFGHFCTERDGLVLLHSGSRARKAVLLFKYLLARYPLAVSESEVAALLWPEATTGTAVNLRSLLHQLRLALGLTNADGLSLEHAGAMIALKLGPTDWWDVAEFEAQLRAGTRCVRAGHVPEALGAYSTAAALYEGDYLSEDAAYDWLESRREQLRQDHLRSLGELARLYGLRREHAEQEVALRTLLRADPYREDSIRALMTLLAARGRGAEALLLYRNLEQRVRNEFDALPDPLTAQLAQQIGHRAVALAR